MVGIHRRRWRDDRIGGGGARRLKTLTGRQTRPTGRVRQALRPGAGSARILAFAHREACTRVVLVEASPAAVEALRENVRALASAGGEARVFRQDARVALAGLANDGAAFDVIYLDPPYESDLYEPLLELVAARGLLSEEGVAVAEHFHKRPLPATIGGLARSREVRVGDHRLSFYRHAVRGGRG
jgi:16S rRNA (guanine(966)-N(2))-methyltransferase RsmD